MPTVLTDNNFKSEVLDADGLTLVDVHATWCGPCKMLGPIIDSLVVPYQGKAKIAKLDIGVGPVVAADYNISSVPTILYFKNGEVIDSSNGFVPKAAIENKLDELI